MLKVPAAVSAATGYQSHKPSIKTSYAIDVQTQWKRKAMSIANRIKQARAKSGLSQSEAASKWGVSVRTLQNWEIDKNEPRGFARAQLDKLIDGILGKPEPKPQSKPTKNRSPKT